MLLEGAQDRWDAVAESLLLYAARHDHVVRHILPALVRGVWVICDRFADSTFAYQGYGRGLAIADLMALHRFALGDVTPDLTLILDLPVAEGFGRMAGRSGGPDRFERLDRDFHERLRQGFRRIAADNPDRCRLIDASGDVAGVQHTIFAAVRQRFGVPLTDG